MEDIIAVLNGRQELVGECWGMPYEVREYLRDSFRKLQHDENFLNALPGLIPHGYGNREEIILFIIDQLARIPLVHTFSGQISVYHTEDPLCIAASMEGADQMLARRDFQTKDEMLGCLSELGISTERTASDVTVHALNDYPLEILSKWALLNPLS